MSASSPMGRPGASRPVGRPTSIAACCQLVRNGWAASDAHCLGLLGCRFIAELDAQEDWAAPGSDEEVSAFRRAQRRAEMAEQRPSPLHQRARERGRLHPRRGRAVRRCLSVQRLDLARDWLCWRSEPSITRNTRRSRVQALLAGWILAVANGRWVRRVTG
jgi:hypothetical protein